MTSLWDWGRFHRNSRYVIVRIMFKRDLLAKRRYSFRYILMLTKLKYLIKDCSSNRRDKSTTYLKTVPQWKYLYLFCVYLNNIQSPLILKNKEMKKLKTKASYLWQTRLRVKYATRVMPEKFCLCVFHWIF